MPTEGGWRRFLLAVAVLFAAACSESAGDSAYETSAVEIGDVRDIVPATGTLLAAGMAEVRAPRAGVMAAVYVKEGDTVRAGQVLATLSAPTRAPAGDMADAGAAASEAAIREAQIAIRQAEEQLARSRTLQDRGFVSAAATAQVQAQVDRARATVDRLTAERTAALARARLAQAEGVGSDILAPLDGVVTLVDARVGQRVTPEDARPLFQTVQDEKAMTLEIMVSEADLNRVSLDSQVLFTVDSSPGVLEQARLVSLGRAPIREGRFVSYRALAEYDNSFGVLRPGLSASVQLVRANARNVLRIPAQATFYKPNGYVPPLPPGKLEELLAQHKGDMGMVRASADGLEIGRMLRTGKRVVFVLVNGSPQRREVLIGGETDDFIEITEGLREGEQVVLKNRTDSRGAV
ncbi:efflux RND transporter periplasmic adaptor subunit [Brevundimonas phoenicis]|uniref:efflux RND transporter periplasmic adaptor subunit n=1 Tax=unclassified Brevundimonas TaxID=2622653 RepID=UPI00399F9740